MAKKTIKVETPVEVVPEAVPTTQVPETNADGFNTSQV